MACRWHWTNRSWEGNCESDNLWSLCNRSNQISWWRSGYLRTFVMKPYGEEWRKQRRMMGQDFSPNTIPRYYHLQETEAQKLIRSIIEDPSSLGRQVRWYVFNKNSNCLFNHCMQENCDYNLTCHIWILPLIRKRYIPHRSITSDGKFQSFFQSWCMVCRFYPTMWVLYFHIWRGYWWPSSKIHAPLDARYRLPPKSWGMESTHVQDLLESVPMVKEEFSMQSFPLSLIFFWELYSIRQQALLSLQIFVLRWSRMQMVISHRRMKSV